MHIYCIIAQRDFYMFEKHNVRLRHLESVATELLNYSEGIRIFAFYAPMGAGKTTFIQAICHVLGSEDNITSPTFAIINEYQTSLSETIYHFDFYRIKNLDEAYDLGYEDYFFSGNYCLIEWPEKIEPLLPDQYIEVHMEATGNDIRTIRAKLIG
jgi:tRNA threonylcarbamoyladenosine biosynthesis protein TsaE